MLPQKVESNKYAEPVIFFFLFLISSKRCDLSDLADKSPVSNEPVGTEVSLLKILKRKKICNRVIILIFKSITGIWKLNDQKR